MSYACELPPELLNRPLTLVFLAGLDISSNEIHRKIWESFTANRRQDRLPIQFKNVDFNHEYPKSKPKKQTYEWYMPKGILKSGWITKHLSVVPAVVALFFDLEWDDPNWKTRLQECSKIVTETAKNRLAGRITKVAVVLIQRHSSLPTGDDIIAQERASSLCNTCGLLSNSLFVLSALSIHSDQLFGYTIRLENAFYELAISYYHSETRRVKAHREYLNKTSHLLLFIRHQFKIAFLHELKQDPGQSLKNYKQCYSHISEARAYSSNMLELKTVAAFVNYKICRLSFQQNNPLDAIDQFRKHTDLHKNRIGDPELAFEHYAWMCKQFSVFGEIFEEAIKLGLPALQTQHPGFYYQQAALHAISRKSVSRELARPAANPPTLDPLAELSRLEFYGQRPWRQGDQSITPADPVRESEGVAALKQVELSTNHCWIVIPLLSNAVSQFKKYRCYRMKRCLMVQMATEYYEAQDYSKCLTLIQRVVWDYRADRWWTIFTSVLQVALNCAYLTASAADYLPVAFELMGKYCEIDNELKTAIQMNVNRILEGDTPDPPLTTSNHCPWPVLRAPWETITVNMRALASFIECKARFLEASYLANEIVHIKVYFRVSCQFPVQFDALQVSLSNSDYNKHCLIDEGIYLVPNTTRCFDLSFVPAQEDVGKKMEIREVSLKMGRTRQRVVVLSWQGAGGDAASLEGIQESRVRIRGQRDLENPFWDEITLRQSAELNHRRALIEVLLDHDPPILVNEIHPIKIRVDNQEKSEISEMYITVGVKDNADPSSKQSLQLALLKPTFNEDDNCWKVTHHHEGRLPAASQLPLDVFLRSATAGERTLTVKTSYKIHICLGSNEEEITCQCHLETVVVLPVVVPFETTVKVTDMNMAMLPQVHSRHPFLLTITVRNISPKQLLISDSALKLDDQNNVLERTDGLSQSQLALLELGVDEVAQEVFGLCARRLGEGLLGWFSLNWKRSWRGRAGAPDDLTPFLSVLPLPLLTVIERPLSLTAVFPSVVAVHERLPLRYVLANNTGDVVELAVTMESSDGFMLLGMRRFTIRLLPFSERTMAYSLFPLNSGNIPLPKMLFTSTDKLDLPMHNDSRTHAFILPRGVSLVEGAKP